MIPFPKLYNSPLHVSYIPNFLSLQEIHQIQKDIPSVPYSNVSISGPDGNPVKDSRRDSKIKWIPINETWDWLYNTILDTIQIHNSIHWKYEITELTDHIQYTEYHDTTSGHYDWHFDVGPNKMSHRKLSISIQLSSYNEYEGGSLEFFNPFDPNPSPKDIGSGVIFPSYFPHKVTPVTKGIRRSLVFWVGGSHFK